MVRRAVVFVVVLVAALLLGRLGSGVDDGPSLEVEQSLRAPRVPEGGDPARTVRDRAALPGGSEARGASAGVWQRLPDPGVAPRDAHTTVWTGQDVLAWGGFGPFGSGDGLHDDGVALDVATGSWQAIPPAPLAGLVNHTAVWTGAPAGGPPSSGGPAGDPPAGEMLVWSVQSSGHRGAALDPGTGRWRLLAADPLPHRVFHTAVWTGPHPGHAGEMLVWAGPSDEDGPGGAAYDPVADRWRVLPDPPGGEGSRVGFTATWTGREMIVVGGTDTRAAAPPAGALAYYPATDRWRVLPDLPGGERHEHAAVWTGRNLLVWGGFGGGGQLARPIGLSYDPDTGAWSEIPEPPDGARAGHAAVWAGDRMVVWGGAHQPADGRPAGVVYDPAEQAWQALGGPTRPRVPHRLVWTGQDLVVLDGRSLSGGLRYTPGGGQPAASGPAATW